MAPTPALFDLKFAGSSSAPAPLGSAPAPLQTKICYKSLILCTEKIFGSMQNQKN